MEVLGYIFTGVLLGVLSGMFGIGGSIQGTIILKAVFGLPDLIALATPLPVTIPSALSGTLNYWKKGLIDKKVALWTIIGGLPSTIIGALATRLVSGRYLMVLTGLITIYLAIRLFRNGKADSKKYTLNMRREFIALLIGIIAGFISGLLAIGGGLVMVPAFILLLGFSMQEAAANSLICIAAFAIPGSMTHWFLGNIDWKIAFYLSLGVIPSGYWGSKIATSMKSRQLELLFAVLLFIFGVYFVSKELNIF